MKHLFEDTGTGGRLSLLINDRSLKGAGILNEKKETTNTIVFNTGPAQTVTIDQVPYAFPANSALALVAHHHFIFEQPENLVAWQFNREFYCIVDHDAEVGCAGFLFYGIHHPMILQLTADERKVITLLKNLCVEDMVVKVAAGSFSGRAVINRSMPRLIVVVVELVSYQVRGVPVFRVFQVHVAGVEVPAIVPVPRAHVVRPILPEEEVLPAGVLIPQIAL